MLLTTTKQTSKRYHVFGNVNYVQCINYNYSKGQ